MRPPASRTMAAACRASSNVAMAFGWGFPGPRLFALIIAFLTGRLENLQIQKLANPPCRSNDGHAALDQQLVTFRNRIPNYFRVLILDLTNLNRIPEL